VTLLAPLKHITALKLSKLTIFVSVTSFLEQTRPKILVASESAPILLPQTPSEILEKIGGDLRQLREQHHLSIEDLSARTQLQPRLIQAIEEGHIEMLPESVYVRGMVKRYANSLGLNGLEISQQVPTWEPETATFESVTRLQQTGFKPSIRIKPIYIYLGYAVAIVGLSAATSRLLNNAIGSPAQIDITIAQPRLSGTAPQHRQSPSLRVGISQRY
jgi:transcriptional regulator with XRE-family HTH domain